MLLISAHSCHLQRQCRRLLFFSSSNCSRKKNSAKRVISGVSTAPSESTFASPPPPPAPAHCCWLDLRGSGLSILERLCLEEALLKHDDRNWMCVGTHDPTPHRYLKQQQQQQQSHHGRRQLARNDDDDDDDGNVDADFASDTAINNKSCCIVMGLGGKPELLLNMPKVAQDNVMVIKRFSGGGTVVLDHNSLWTTLIGRTTSLKNVEPYPRSIMAYSATALFEPMWHDLRAKVQAAKQQQQQKASQLLRPTMVLDTKSCAVENTGRLIQIKMSSSDSSNSSNDEITTFSLRDNDYVLGDFKMAGNAQAIVKEGWLHHTSFLWDYHDENMNYLTLPSRRPDYRGNRTHGDFLTKLRHVLHPLKPHDFCASLQRACQAEFQLQLMTVPDAMAVVRRQWGTWDNCLAHSRNRIIDVAAHTTAASVPPTTTKW